MIIFRKDRVGALKKSIFEDDEENVEDADIDECFRHEVSKIGINQFIGFFTAIPVFSSSRN